MLAGKGQISIEFIFTLISLFTIAMVLAAISQNFIYFQNEIHLRSQEKKIAETIAEIVGVSAALDDAPEGQGIVQYRIPEIYALGKASTIPCTVTIEAETIKVSADYGRRTIAETSRFIKPAKEPAGTLKSGETLVMDYT